MTAITALERANADFNKLKRWMRETTPDDLRVHAAQVNQVYHAAMAALQEAQRAFGQIEAADSTRVDLLIHSTDLVGVEVRRELRRKLPNDFHPTAPWFHQRWMSETRRAASIAAAPAVNAVRFAWRHPVIASIGAAATAAAIASRPKSVFSAIAGAYVGYVGSRLTPSPTLI